eukprot:gnl/TRDRNA2_/TRDRNA2_184790_c0_seq1.p1 gnl/TRDRNA2_/TRDRNA2_184790_c0~~gnl/TRDRNA2_/TRDRNA2_184790_c0_seq1.p1  ORF type:complete len:553 (+),score=125.55 gnl/TRDRNA2_/TRDRNA2_184790_c0_seq1:46-1659(+)
MAIPPDHDSALANFAVGMLNIWTNLGLRALNLVSPILLWVWGWMCYFPKLSIILFVLAVYYRPHWFVGHFGGVRLDRSSEKAKAKEVDEPRVKYLGHSCFIYQWKDKSILINPWFFPSAQFSRFPFPDNRFLFKTDVASHKFNYIYISNVRDDHFDKRALKSIPKSATILIGEHARELQGELIKLGFSRMQILFNKKEQMLGRGADALRATLIQDANFKEDASLLLEAPGLASFLHLGGANPPIADLPKVDTCAMAYSDYQWFPICYGEGANAGEPLDQTAKDALRAKLAKEFTDKLNALDPACIIPMDGPSCFLDTMDAGSGVFKYNGVNKETTVYPFWDDFDKVVGLKKNFPKVFVAKLLAGDRLVLSKGKKNKMVDCPTTRPYSATWRKPTGSQIKKYSDERKAEWMAYYSRRYKPVNTPDLQRYLAKLQTGNPLLSAKPGWSKKILFRAYPSPDAATVKIATAKDASPPALGTPKTWMCDVGQGGPTVTEKLGPAEYTFTMPECLLRDIIDMRISWETALNSMRVKVAHNPPS